MAFSTTAESGPPNPFDYFAIRNVISEYCIALDTKSFKLLTEGVFTEDVEAVYPFFTVTGAHSVAERIERRFVPMRSLSTRDCIIV